MRARSSFLALGFAAVAGVAFLAGSLARAGDDAKGGGMPAPAKKIDAAFFQAFAGTFTTVSKAMWGEGKGKATCRPAVGATAFVEEYQNGEGEQAFHGLALYKVGDDGKTLSMWWLDSNASAPAKFEGSLTDDGYEAKGESPHGPTTLAMKKKGEGFEFKMTTGGAEVMTETWTRAK